MQGADGKRETKLGSETRGSMHKAAGNRIQCTGEEQEQDNSQQYLSARKTLK